MSPGEKRKANRVAILPFDISVIIPDMQSNKPTSRNDGIFSFRKIADNRITKTGDDEVPISARLIAEV